MIIFAPEIFKDYLFILARFTVRLPLFSYDLKTFFLFSDIKFAIYLTKIKSEKSTFVFKSPENINHADKNYYQINKYNSKNSTCREINFIKICQEIALKFCFWKNVVLYEIYSKKSRMANTYVHVLYFSKLK